MKHTDSLSNKSPIKIWINWECGISGDCPILGALLSQELVKRWTSNFVRSFKGSIGIKAGKKLGKSSHGRSQGVPKFQGTHVYGSSRGHFRDSTALLFNWISFKY